MNVSTQQLAEILIGIAPSQQAIIDAIDAQKAGFKGTYLSPALDSAAKIRSTRRGGFWKKQACPNRPTGRPRMYCVHGVSNSSNC